MAELIVLADEVGLRLDAFIAKRLDTHSRSRLQKIVDAGLVFVNDTPRIKRYSVKIGDRVVIDELSLAPEHNQAPAAQNIPLSILYEDQWLLAVNKPAGLVVHPGNGNWDGTLVNALLYHIPSLAGGFGGQRPGIVHRLDKETSGVLLVAKTDQVHARLASQFADRSIEKYYLGLCIGSKPDIHGIMDFSLGRSRRDPLKRSIQQDGKKALTEYWLLAHQCHLSVLKFRLHTGRTHQIRIHASHKGFPIVHDSLYGGGQEALNKIAPLERSFVKQVYACFSRQALHARMVKFLHPVTGEPVCVEAPPTEDFTRALGHFADLQPW